MSQEFQPKTDFEDAGESVVSSIEEEAIEWVVRLTSGETTAAERVAFRHWRAQSAEHEAALVMARQLWIGVGRAIPDRNGVSARRRQSRRRVYAIAASLLLAAVAGFQSARIWWHDDMTSTGERRTVALADATQIDLSSDTAIDVDFSGNERHVTLARGEAYFDVTHNADRPFIVKAGDGEVRVLGTAFSVRRDEGGTVVTVERGRVEVKSGGDPVVLTPGLRMRYTNGKHTPAMMVDPYATLAWRRGRLIVEDQSLAEIIRELGRYYPGKIIMTDRMVGQRHLNAVIDLDHIDDWLFALGESQPVKVQRIGPVVLIR